MQRLLTICCTLPGVLLTFLICNTGSGSVLRIFMDGNLAGAKLVGCRRAVMASEYPQRHAIYSLISSTASRPPSELSMQSSLLKYSNLDHVKD